MKNKNRFTKIAVASGLIVASGAAVLGITGFASAELAPQTKTHIAAQADNNNDANGTVNAAGLPAEGQTPDHMGGPNFATDALAKVLGLTTTELQTQLQSGKSLADIAKTQKVDIADVKKQLIADFTEKENAEVKTGEHTQAEVDQKIKDFTANVDNMVNNAGGMRGPGMGGMRDGKGGAPFATDALAKVLGLTTTELQTQLQSGKSLADIAKTQKVDIADVKKQLIADFTEKENAEVKTGEHTQAEVDQKIKDFTANVDNMVNNVRPAGGPGMGGMRGHGGHGPHGDGPMGAMNGAQSGSTGASTQGASFSA